MNRERRCVHAEARSHMQALRSLPAALASRVARSLQCPQRLRPVPNHPSCASRHSVGEVPVACLNACENVEGRGQPSRAATYAIEFPLASRVFARSIRRALAYRPTLCPVSRENAAHKCERLTNSMLASSSRPGARPSSSMRSMAACASRASPDRSCAEAPQRAVSSPAHDAASAATICSTHAWISSAEPGRYCGPVPSSADMMMRDCASSHAPPNRSNIPENALGQRRSEFFEILRKKTDAARRI